ncbi:DUF3857 domain-containing protein [Flammeovirgaceae bacterium SG7u.111]|nr:DUF3857 domain-containing protein [Flammeovirgaceae bacterium SG7u.132]WPO33783.1 DUF3857 domain-containing protein [Flammeovirgaceae bacterium SG7u.111]
MNFTRPAILCSILLLSFIFFSKTIHGQPITYKWGKPNKDETALKVCNYDSAANAVVLVDKMKVTFIPSGVLYTRIKRVKILNKNGFDEADIRLNYYSNDNLESITKLKAQTLLIDKKGNVTKVPVAKKDIFDVEVNEFYNQKRFTFPAIEEGCIIEYESVMLSKVFAVLEKWQFQNEIPTLHSELEVVIPQGLEYRLLFNGSKLIKKYGHQTTNHWILKNMDALKDEEFVGNYMDYAEWVSFQLASYYDNGISGSQTHLMNSWEQLAEDVIKKEEVTRYLNKRGVARNILETIPKLNGKPSKDKMIAIYDYVRGNYSKNGYYGTMTQQKLNELLETKEGMTTEINLLLVLLLREAGLEADPLLISTRTHGRVTEAYPMISQFSDMLAYVKIGEEGFILNATNAARPYNLLDENDLNLKGYLLSKSQPRWVDIEQKKGVGESVRVSVDYSDVEAPKVKVQASYSAYSEMYKRQLIGKKGQDVFLSGLIKPDIADVKEMKVENLEDDSKHLSIASELVLEQLFEEDDEVIYLQPNIIDVFNENPYKQEKRRLPVEQTISQKYSYSFDVILPAGYSVVEVPADVALKLPNNYGKLLYKTTQKEYGFNIMVYLNITDRNVPPVHYKALQQFYTLLSEKLNAQIVLKKAS